MSELRPSREKGSTLPGVRAMVHDWLMKKKFSHVYVTGHIKDPVPLVEKRRAVCPGGRFPANLIHQGV